jgi:FkbH-like protein
VLISEPETVLTTAGAQRSVAAALAAVIDELVDVWLRLEESGPLYGPAPTDPDELGSVVSGYLRPLAQLLIDSLGGSDLHRSLYLDLRPYNLQELAPADRPSVIAEELSTEVASLAELIPGEPEAVDVLMEIHADLLQSPGARAQRVLLIGDCIMPEIRVFLSGSYGGADGLQSTHINFHADFRGFRADEVVRQVELMRPTLIGISLFSHNATPAYAALREDARKLSASALPGRVAGCVDQLREAIEAIRSVTDATILVHSPAAAPKKRRHRYLPESRGMRRFLREMRSQVAELVAASENVIHLDELEVAARVGGRRAASERLLSATYREAWFHPTRFGPALAGEYADVLSSLDLVGGAKALFVDFDNTLWDGVMADGPVIHDRSAQETLKELRRAGVLLIALSKNDPANIRWDEMLLEPDDFVLHKISWRPKPNGAAEAIHELDLAPGAFLFLDDNPAERALVEENVSGVRALDPADPFAWRTLQRWLDVPSTKATPEALKRTEIYRQAAERRRALGGAQDYGEMMASLNLRAEARPAREADLERLLELVQRTNQFNTTTRRRSRAEVRALLTSADHDVTVSSLRDRFGDLGVVAVVVTDLLQPGIAEIDSFVMSCRAMGFGLEYLLLNELTSGKPELEWRGRFIPTDRNGPASGLFATAGFGQAADDDELWTLATDAARPERPKWFG